MEASENYVTGDTKDSRLLLAIREPTIPHKAFSLSFRYELINGNNNNKPLVSPETAQVNSRSLLYIDWSSIVRNRLSW